jgi:hypothetical protein
MKRIVIRASQILISILILTVCMAILAGTKGCAAILSVLLGLKSCTCNHMSTSFDSSAIAQNGQIGIFSAEQTYSVTDMFFPPEEKCRIHCSSKGRGMLGSYDPKSGQIKILRRYAFKESKPECGAGPIDEVAGSIVSVGGGTSYCLLDLRSGHTTTLPVYSEMVERGLKGRLTLLDESGTLVINNELKKHVSLNSYEADLWVRHPKGQYRHLGVTSDEPRNLQGRIYFYNLVDRRTMAYNLSDRSLRQVDTREYTNKYSLQPRPEKLVDLQVSSSQGISVLQWMTRRGIKWQPTGLSIRAEEIFANF